MQDNILLRKSIGGILPDGVQDILDDLSINSNTDIRFNNAVITRIKAIAVNCNKKTALGQNQIASDNPDKLFKNTRNGFDGYYFGWSSDSNETVYIKIQKFDKTVPNMFSDNNGIENLTQLMPIYPDCNIYSARR